MSPSRRRFLQVGALVAAGSGLPFDRVLSRAFAAPGAAGARFLLVFLRGGYDATSALVPVASDFYYESRPTIAVARPDPANPLAAVPLGRPGESPAWGLHPALAESMLPLWQKGQLAFVPFAGTEDLTRSHFETQDSIERGMPANPDGGRFGSGFLNRLAAELGGAASPVAFTDGLPVVLSGDVLVPNVALKGPSRLAFDDRQVALFEGMYAGSRFAPLVAEGFQLRKSVAELSEMMQSGVPGEMQAASRNAITPSGFELEARRMAGLMQRKFDLGFIDVGGWDTHLDQGSAQGRLATLLSNLGRGLSAFAGQMGASWDSTVVVVLSEFGRTFRENGTRGTDHGHGSVYWVLGGAVHGGRLAGEQKELVRETLNQDRDLPVLNDYRALLGGLFRRLYGLDETRLGRVFPASAPADLGLV